MFGDDLQDLLLPPTDALRHVGGANTGPPHLLKCLLDDPVLQGMKSNDADSSPPREQEGGIIENLSQLFQLFIHRNPQG